MRINIVFVFLILAVNLKGQDVTNRINEIREMYQKTLMEKENYTTQAQDITWESFEHNEEEDRTLKKTITYYYDANKIKIAVISTSIISDYSSYKLETECYYENDSIFFIYSVERSSERTSLNPEQSNEMVNVKEKRIYFDVLGNCIRFLNKEANGTPDMIDSLCQKEQNVSM
ncbi:hypothetical protein [Williamwhitmania taraxaci]|uniref:Uncharacterized protein n=1 Tax=Williamwhitmania taraxaci TaxID=1640674 RepID=A0A1G6THD3_9BACT|nr:hypothetical protein [Williamwhitmania taraxaci]SDD28451.1 hypothetical protein SAMN05216323_11234 [Williamwhitmania taraxaci]